MIKLSNQIPIEIACQRCDTIIDHNGSYDAEVYIETKDYPQNVANYIEDNCIEDVSVRMAFYVEDLKVEGIGFLVYTFDGQDDVHFPDEEGYIKKYIEQNFSEYIDY